MGCIKITFLELLFLTTLLQLISCKSYLLLVPKSHYAKKDMTECDVLKNEALHALLDKACRDCHDISENPNFHYQCGTNCYDNPEFEECWSFITGVSRRRRR